MSDKKKQTEKDLVVKAKGEMTTSQNSHLDNIGTTAADSSDIIIPRILLMQGTSKWVAEGQASQGDIINSMTEEKLGGKGESFKIIPFFMRKTWEIFADDGSGDWIRSDTWSAANDNLEWQFSEEDEVQGSLLRKRQRQYSFHCMLDADIGEGFPVPCIISFRSSSGFKEGKKIASHFAMMKGLGQPGHNVTWSVESQSIKEGNKAYQKYIIKKAGNTTEEASEACYQWLNILSTNSKIKEHSVEDGEASVSPTAPASATEVDTIPF